MIRDFYYDNEMKPVGVEDAEVILRVILNDKGKLVSEEWLMKSELDEGGENT